MAVTTSPKSKSKSKSKSFPAWAFLSLATNGLLFVTVALLLVKTDRALPPSQVKVIPISTPKTDAEEAASLATSLIANLQPRQQLTYEQWVDLLDKEAAAIVKNNPNRLTVLAGDSLSLWFPAELLPADRTWLNQSISGETSAGLLKRLDLFEKAEPQAIFVMIGINDLLKGGSDKELLDYYQRIIKTLKKNHPKSKIIVQSILPHANRSTVENPDRLSNVSNQRIYNLNRKIAAIVKESKLHYLDLQPLFTNNEGYLRSELTTDGLHLSSQGYLVWRSAIQTFSQLVLESELLAKP
ncbi:MAG: lysophospholipase [Leptolyngbyaceae cyanobacterium CSU_1_3]|nr:lysophospholipase [Leptolyngbyaceae cyanobacterium CSU_1_3]